MYNARPSLLALTGCNLQPTAGVVRRPALRRRVPFSYIGPLRGDEGMPLSEESDGYQSASAAATRGEPPAEEKRFRGEIECVPHMI